MKKTLLKTFFKNWLIATAFSALTAVGVLVPFYIGFLLKGHPIILGAYVILVFTGLFALLATLDGGLGW